MLSGADADPPVAGTANAVPARYPGAAGLYAAYGFEPLADAGRRLQRFDPAWRLAGRARGGRRFCAGARGVA